MFFWLYTRSFWTTFVKDHCRDLAASNENIWRGNTFDAAVSRFFRTQFGSHAAV